MHSISIRNSARASAATITVVRAGGSFGKNVRHTSFIGAKSAWRERQGDARCCGRRRDYVAGQRWCLRRGRSDEQGKEGCGRDDQCGERSVDETNGHGGPLAQRDGL